MSRLFSLTVCALLSSAGALTQQKEIPVAMSNGGHISTKSNVAPPVMKKPVGPVITKQTTISAAKGSNILSKNATSKGNSTNQSVPNQQLYQEALNNMTVKWGEQMGTATAKMLQAPVKVLQAQKQALGAAMNATDEFMLKVKAYTPTLPPAADLRHPLEKLDPTGQKSGTGYHYDPYVGTTAKEHWVPNAAENQTAVTAKVTQTIAAPAVNLLNPWVPNAQSGNASAVNPFNQWVPNAQASNASAVNPFNQWVPNAQASNASEIGKSAANLLNNGAFDLFGPPYVPNAQASNASAVNLLNPWVPNAQASNASAVNLLNPWAPNAQASNASAVNLLNPWVPNAQASNTSAVNLLNQWSNAAQNSLPQNIPVLVPVSFDTVAPTKPANKAAPTKRAQI